MRFIRLIGLIFGIREDMKKRFIQDSKWQEKAEENTLRAEAAHKKAPSV